MCAQPADTPAVSIVMPTFNRLEHVPAAVACVLAQTFSDWELLIADDGSDAATRAYLQAVQAPPRIRVICLEHSGKPSLVRNAALREARGEYVAFLDSDDMWAPTKLHRQVTSLRANPARHWSYTRFVLIDARGQPAGPAGASNQPAPGGWILERLLHGEVVIALPSVMVRRDLLARLGPFDEELVMCEDDELWYRLAAHSEIDGVDEPLTLIRRHTHHGGSDVIAWRDRRRVIEKSMRAFDGSTVRAVLRRLHAESSVGLARSQAASGERMSALGTVLSSAHYSWRYPQWWRGALAAFAPAAMRRAVNRYRVGAASRSRPQA